MRTENLRALQRWVILRNASGPGGAILQLGLSYWRWCGNRNTHSLKTGWLILPAIFVGLASLACGIYLPRLVFSKVTDDIIVIAQPGTCGFRQLSADADDIAEVAATTARELEETIDGRRYAEEMYQNTTQTHSGFAGFPSLALPYSVDNVAACPFAEDICLLGPNSAISFDTGLLDSHEHFGINAGTDDRVQYRWLSTYTPLKLDTSLVTVITDGERDGFPVTEYQPIFDIYLGEQENQPYTISWQMNGLSRVGYQILYVFS